MDQLYWNPVHNDKEPDLHGLEAAENVRTMARIVGDEAAEQAASFLDECSEKVAAHWHGIKLLKITGQSRRKKMAYEWVFQGRLRTMPPKKGASIWYGAGIDEFKGIIIPWLYGRGGRDWEDLAMRTLGKRAHSRAGEGLISDRGTVALACITLLPQNLEGFDVDRDPVVSKVVDCFTAIRTKDLEILARPIGGDEE
jgi:hypothetical protein